MGNFSDWFVPLITVFGTIFAGAGLKWVEGFLKRAKDKDDTATSLRQELRTELTSLKEEMSKIEDELAQWREKYYHVTDQLLTYKFQLETAKRMLAESGKTLPEAPALSATVDIPLESMKVEESKTP